MTIDNFTDKLNKLEENISVIEEEVRLTTGIYEAELRHDNINIATLEVFTRPKLTGERIQSVLSTPSFTPCKRVIRIYADVQVVYISYETDGDIVEADNMNRVHGAIVKTKEAVSEEEGWAEVEEKVLTDNLIKEYRRAIDTENNIRSTTSANKLIWDDKYTRNKVDDKLAALDTDQNYTHPNSGVEAGIYQSVTVNDQVHVTAGINPSTLAEYGISDAATKMHNHDSTYLKRVPLPGIT